MSASTNVHLIAQINPNVNMEFTDHIDCPSPFRTLRLHAGEYTLNVFVNENNEPNLAEILKQIIEVSTKKLNELESGE